MLEFLVTSKARRRMLLLLWGQHESGSASDLASRAHVGFASAWRELRAMQALGLVTSNRDGPAEVFRANLAHPQAEALKAMVTAPAQPPAEVDDARTRGELRSMGAPLFDEPRAVEDVEASLVRGVHLARRDATVARSLPLCFFSQRERLRPERLAEQAERLGEARSLGFFLDLTSSLSKDRRFAAWAKPLHDGRWVAERDFFSVPGRGHRVKVTSPPSAKRWNLRMDMDREVFASTFEKFRGG